jgi:hypothetical protein
MNKHTVIASALAAALGFSLPALAAEDAALAQIRADIQKMKESYEARIIALEERLKESENKASKVAAAAPAAVPVSPSAIKGTANTFNPEVSLILGGSYARLSQNPENYRIQGFAPVGGEIGPGRRSFNLGESELRLSANVDPHFSGKITFALSSDNTVSVEEAYFRTNGLAGGLNLKGGRFLSAVGYQNSQHAHTWDFVDAPLVYQAMFGGQYKQDGLQLRWLAPTERYLELGMEAGNGNAAPGNDRNRNGAGSVSVFAHVGDDLGDSASWRAGVSYLHTGAKARSYTDTNTLGNEASNSFEGKSRLWILDGVYKWAPNGNASRTSFKLQGEYFRRTERGSLTYTDDTAAVTEKLAYASAQSGAYIQGVYQFRPEWRVGLRYDRLNSAALPVDLSGSTLTAADFPMLANYKPSKTSLMFDYSPSEFSRLRLQFAQDKSRPDAIDNQILLQYIMSLGAHGAHAF